MPKPNRVSDETFSDFIMLDKSTLILFGASWSGHTQLMEKVVESVSEQFGNDIQTCVALADDCTETIAKFGIRQVPSLALFRKGRLLGVRIGLQSRDDTSAFVREIL